MRGLLKIEAVDSSPLDAPGRPLNGFGDAGPVSWDKQISDSKPKPKPAAAPPPQKTEPKPVSQAKPNIEAKPELKPEPKSELKLETDAPPQPKVVAGKPEESEKPAPPADQASSAAVAAAPAKPVASKPQAKKRLAPQLRKKPDPAKPVEPAKVAEPAKAAEPAAAKPRPQAKPAAAPPPPMKVLPPPPRPRRPYQKRADRVATATGIGGGIEKARVSAAGPPLPVEREPEAAVRGALSALRDQTDLSHCILPLLNALHWRGDPRHVAEALPHFIDNIDITSFRNILATLHFGSRSVSIRLAQIDQRLMPCLFLPEGGDAMILLDRQMDGIKVFHGGRNEAAVVAPSRLQGTAYFFNAVETEDLLSAQQKVGWFRAVNERFRSLFYQALGISFILNILALATPLFVMAVYDKVVSTGSLTTLAFFSVGVTIAICCDLILRYVRSKILAFIGARLDNIVGLAIFHKILFLPPALTERATVGAQVARIKDFETIRDFFTGPMALTLLELPFVLIFVAVIFHLGGPLVFVPLIMVAMFGILAVIFSPLIRTNVSRAARASSKRQELVVESLNNMRAIKYCGAEATWLNRFRDLSAKSSLSGFHTS